MKWVVSATAGLMLGISGCSDSVGSSWNVNTDVTISLSKSIYRWDEIPPSDGLAVTATVENQGDQVYFSRLGDGFNSLDEQDLLYVATGSDAFLERSTSGSWHQVERATLVEGVKVVTLNPSGSYTLMAYLLGDRITGTFRLRIAFGTSSDGEEPAGEAISQTLEIR